MQLQPDGRKPEAKNEYIISPALQEPILTTKLILDWIGRTEGAQVNINFSTAYGWNFTLCIDNDPEPGFMDDEKFTERFDELE